MTNNHYSNGPVTDVTSPDIRCYDTAEPGTATTIQVDAGSQMGIMSNDVISHPGVVNVYMAKAPDSVDDWAGDGDVWFKVYELSAVTDGGSTITFPAWSESRFFVEYMLVAIENRADIQPCPSDEPGVTFTLPKELPSGQ
jgi:hypothetical protein